MFSDMRNQMSAFVRAHEASVESYEQKIAKLEHEKEVLSKDNEVLLAAADEYEHDLEVLAEAKEYECEQYKVDAFQACEVLQAEIDMLRRLCGDDEGSHASEE